MYKRLLLLSIAAFPSIAFSGPMITGGISMYGDFNAVDSAWNSVGLDVATGLDFIGDDFVVDQATGSFATEGVSKNDTGYLQDFQFNPLLPAPVNPLWSIGGFNFVLQSVTIVNQSTSHMELSGTGYIVHANYQTTQGTWTLKANAKIGQFFFGSSTTAVPEPGTLLLFGAGLVGLAFTQRRRRSRH